ncbi:MAG TPA: hypothetical protein VN408_26645 [Actinoplanes sp.]|nr:hypothetical protein [Actinoplanes sp.]
MNRAEATPVDGSRSTTEPPASSVVAVPVLPAGDSPLPVSTGVTVTRRPGPRRGAVATRRVVGL